MGFEVKRFQGEVEEDLLCPLCKKVLQEATVGPCGHAFCKECLGKYFARLRDMCPVCNATLAQDQVAGADKELLERLGKLSLRCTHEEKGCDTVLEYHRLAEHLDRECSLRLVPCEHKNCPDKVHHRDLKSHIEMCDYRLVECKVCKICLPRKDMPAHQAVKRCFEELNKRRIVKNARRVSQELKEHYVDISRQRHTTEQIERSLVRNHYLQENSTRHKRSMSAGPVLMRSSIEARVGSAMVVPHYSRTLKSAVIDTCMDCTNKFIHGRHPSARRHTHIKCDHCQTWRMWNGPRGWVNALPPL